jgi:hypothetical protein
MSGGLRSQRKGLRTEYLVRDQLIAAGIPARKLSRAYQPSHDVEAVVRGRTLKVQVKGRAKGYAAIHSQLNGTDVLIIKRIASRRR